MRAHAENPSPLPVIAVNHPPSAQAAKRFPVLPYAAATLVGAFLVFQVQPVISKCVLPWFGGTPAVWTTCMLFFQVLLLAGYIYAHCLKTYLRPRRQGLVHLSLLTLALWTLDITPDENWKPSGDEQPIVHLLVMLCVHVGLPYFLLSSTGPLIQAWLSLRTSSDSIYRLYALSNIGSLAALLSYPFLVEPYISVAGQSALWGFLFTLFVLVQTGLIYQLVTSRSSSSQASQVSSHGAPPKIRRWKKLLWVALPAVASTLLLVTTAQLCSEVAVVPFLWILPLSLYLISFIISFDSPRYYQPKWTAAIALASLAALQITWLIPTSIQMLVTGACSSIFLFSMCLLCHGEVARLRPPVTALTQFYVCLSIGGAIGGVIVAIFCPLMLSSYSEIPVAQATGGAIALLLLVAHRSWSWSDQGRIERSWKSLGLARVLAFTLPLLSIGAAYHLDRPGIVSWDRNFFGVVRVEDEDGVRTLAHGSTSHGKQRHAPFQQEPTEYYARQSGVGKAIIAAGTERTLKIGVVGLGCGVLAAYGREGDHFDFIEINPAVIEIAKQKFSFIRDSYATVSLHLGDGRLALERMEPHQYDILVIDAFSSDAIPAHLLTLEAIALYKKMLAPAGMLAIHVSNNHLDLAPLVHRLANENELESRLVTSRARPKEHVKAALWMLASEPNNPLWDAPELWEAMPPTQAELDSAPRWTDQSHNLFSVMRAW
jgi:hypothetical protein